MKTTINLKAQLFRRRTTSRHFLAAVLPAFVTGLLIVAGGIARAADLRLHVIALSNTNGDLKHSVDEKQFYNLVDRVNKSYEGTNIHFVFDPAKDWEEMADTDLNTDTDQQRDKGNKIAATHPGQIVCFLRYGKDDNRGNGNAYPPPGNSAKNSVIQDVEQDYVALPNYIDELNFGGLNQGNGSFVAHELGHYLGLYHTFPAWGDMKLDTAQKIVNYISSHGGDESAFDGDVLTDTPYDPGPDVYDTSNLSYCGNTTINVKGQVGSVAIGGKIIPIIKTYTFAPDARNVMSYFKYVENCDKTSHQRFTPKQIQQMSETLQFSSRRALLNGSSPEGPAAVITPQGNIHVFARGDDRSIWHAVYSNSRWSAWQNDAGAGIFASGAAAAVTPAGDIHVFGVGTDRNIWHSYWNGAVWTGFGTDLGTGVFKSTPAAVVTASGEVHVIARGSDDNMWRNVWNAKSWSGWKADMGAGVFTSAPSAAISSDGAIHVFARGTDLNMWHSFLKNNGWSGWKADLGSGVLASGPSVAVTSDGLIHVFARGLDRAIWQSYWNGSSWSGWNSNLAAGSFTSGATVAAAPGGTIHAFALGDNRTVYHSVWNGTKWSAWTAETGTKSFQP